MINQILPSIREIYIPKDCKLLVLDKDNNVIRQIDQLPYDNNNISMLIIHYPIIENEEQVK